ncbi:MAG TPA: peptide deformylase [Actinomycetes bacterium]|nr:peptide deformylase [Actinomycetes bacterium]
MAILEIRQFGDPVLREHAAEVTEFNAWLARFGDDLLGTMRAAYGVGLAAPQVGVLLRLFAYDVPLSGDGEDGGDGERVSGVLVNPVITRREGEQTGLEGCLSFPGLYYDCTRALEVTVQAQDVAGSRLEVTGEGMLARVFQHEIDHLDGLLFIDRLSRGDRKRAMREWRERDLGLESPGTRPHLHRSDIAKQL